MTLHDVVDELGCVMDDTDVSSEELAFLVGVDVDVIDQVLSRELKISPWLISRIEVELDLEDGRLARLVCSRDGFPDQPFSDS